MDTQVTEILGRNWLINELLRAGLEVATPLRDRGPSFVILGTQSAGNGDRKEAAP